MKKIFTIGSILISAIHALAQINAVTDTGEEVLLYNDGTWAYVNDNAGELIEIKLNEKEFIKSESSSFLVKSQTVNMGVWIDPGKWSFNKGGEGEAAEFQFKRKGKELHGMLISEEVEIPVETLKGIALGNARNAAPDIKIVR